MPERRPIDVMSQRTSVSELRQRETDEEKQADCCFIECSFHDEYHSQAPEYKVPVVNCRSGFCSGRLLVDQAPVWCMLEAPPINHVGLGLVRVSIWSSDRQKTHMCKLR